MEKDPYTRKLKVIYSTMMTGFPELTNKEIDMICDLYQLYRSNPGLSTTSRTVNYLTSAYRLTFCKTHSVQAIVHECLALRSFLFVTL
jgi:hypothetical protein